MSAIVALSLIPPAQGHGFVKSTRPKARSRIGAPPPRVVVRLTEPPKAGRLRVIDGCGRNVAHGVRVSGDAIVGRVRASQPGRWRVRWKAISKVDDDLTQGRFSFRVAGRPDCDPDPTPTPESTPETSPTVAAGEDEGGTPEDRGSVPWVPIGLGAAGLAAVAVIGARVAATRKHSPTETGR